MNYKNVGKIDISGGGYVEVKLDNGRIRICFAFNGYTEGPPLSSRQVKVLQAMLDSAVEDADGGAKS